MFFLRRLRERLLMRRMAVELPAGLHAGFCAAGCDESELLYGQMNRRMQSKRY